MQMKDRQQELAVLAVGPAADTVVAMAMGRFALAVAEGQPGAYRTDVGDTLIATQARAQCLAFE